MWQKIVEKAQELIKVAEGLKDLTGPEKKAYVVKLMCDNISIPGVPAWIERMIEPPLYGWIVDKLVGYWNKATEHHLETIPNVDEITAEITDVVVNEIKACGAGVVDAIPDVDEKFNVLLEKYGVGAKG